jgi:hypothetical protein
MKNIQLSIPEKCHQNWEQMTQADKGKFCKSCQKTVIDFTNMHDRELAQFFKKPAGSVCGRFPPDQLERDIFIPKKRIPWIKYFFQFSIPAFLFSMKGSAQGKVAVKRDTLISITPIEQLKPQLPDENLLKKLSGIVTDNSGVPIAGATVMIKGTKTGAATDINGNFILKAKQQNEYTLIISSIGFNAKQVLVTPNGIDIIIPLTQLENLMFGDVIVTNKKKKRKSLALISSVIDTAFKNFSVYPNPIQTNSIIKIDMRKLAVGEYSIFLLNISGETIQTKDATLKNKKQVIDMQLAETSAGIYFVRVINRKTSASYSVKKIIVQ